MLQYTYDVLYRSLQWIVTEDASGLPENNIQRKGYTYTPAGDVNSIKAIKFHQSFNKS